MKVAEYQDTPYIAQWKREIADLMARPRLPLSAEDPLRINDVFMTNCKSGPYRLDSIHHCPGCRFMDVCIMDWPHMHFACSRMDRLDLTRHEASGSSLSGYRYIGDRLLGRQFKPNTAGYVAIHGDEEGEGIDEIFLIYRPVATALDIDVRIDPKPRNHIDSCTRLMHRRRDEANTTTLSMEGLFE